MRWSLIFELFKVNILYSNPQALARLRRKREKKGDKNYSISMGMIRMQLFQILAFCVLYLHVFINLNYRLYPGLLSIQIATFFVMALSQTFSAMFSIFYESNDLRLYAHMPINSSEIYMAKTLASLGMGSTFLMPLLSCLIIASWQLYGPIGILVAVPLFLLLWVECFILALSLLQVSGRFLLKLKYRKAITTILMSGIAFLGIIVVSGFNGHSSRQDGSINIAPIPFFRGFYDAAQNLMSRNSLVHFWLPLVLFVALAFWLYRVIMPRYYRFALTHSAKPVATKKKVTKPQTLKKLLLKHHLHTFASPTLISQTFILQFVLPLTGLPVLLTESMNNERSISAMIATLPIDFAGSFALAGIFMGLMYNHMSTFVGVAMSLEKGNYSFLKSLPINYAAFARQKFLTAFLLQNLPGFFLYLLAGILLKLHPILLISFLLGYAVSASIVAQSMYRRDLKKLTLNWQDVTHLLARDGASWLVGLLYFVVMMLGYGLILAAVLLTIFWKAAIVNQVIFTVALVAGIVCQWLLYKNFWKPLT